ncbi:beta-lactamase family protein [Paenibacillus sp. 7124]|uniref:Beta-lactamase family protein n=1 Tax=Paenibacillus apii TaxID=1850370 RepID=A0A6M1PL58_9BACL|nr:serine hydrolase domain-containing protein [Paenibacillus apii]NGM83178.1 beta-lactamase family protein [Paenibacillus apii]
MQDIQEKIHEYLSRLSDGIHFSGSVLASLNGKVVFQGDYGKSNFELSTDHTERTRFRIGSITKSFTAIAILQLTQKKLIQLDDPIIKYFPHQKGSGQITIHHLLTHSSGIVNYVDDPHLLDWFASPSTTIELINRFSDLPLAFEPGQQFSYSNSGYILLGALIECITGKSFGSYFQDFIFKPLDMMDTCIDHPATMINDRASGYQINDEGLLSNAPYIDMSNTHAAGAIISSIRDLFKWDQGIESNSLLSAKMKWKMLTPYLKAAEFSYGYGWIIQDTPYGRVVGHSGGVHGFSSIFLKYIDRQATVIVLSNIFQPVDTIGTAIAEIILNK